MYVRCVQCEACEGVYNVMYVRVCIQCDACEGVYSVRHVRVCTV